MPQIEGGLVLILKVADHFVNAQGISRLREASMTVFVCNLFSKLGDRNYPHSIWLEIDGK